jgi:DNA-binding transcriptional MerR regulator
VTVTKLARACHLARSTVLYYESIGLLARPRRTAGNYRVYTEKDVGRLRQICAYCDAGLELGDIRSILDAPHTDAAAVLRRRLVELSAGIERLQEHQEFLEFLHIPEPEVKAIREWSRGLKAQA